MPVARRADPLPSSPLFGRRGPVELGHTRGVPRRRTIAALVLTGCAALPGPAHGVLPASRPPDAAALRAAGLRVTWPVASTAPVALAGGPPLRVRVARAGRATGARRARARLALVRVDGGGRPMRIVTGGVLTSGPFTARLPARAGARYALRLEVGERRWWSWILTSGPPVPASEAVCPTTGTGAGGLRIEPAAARAGELVTATLMNAGTGCLFAGADYAWDALLPDGTWEPIKPKYGFPLIGPRGVHPGETFAFAIGGLRVFADLQPGPHRLVKTVEGPNGELILYAPFEVLRPSAR